MSGKNLVLSYGLKCSQTIRLKHSLIINISGRNQHNLRFFLPEDNHQGKVEPETTTFGWVWQVVSLDQLDSRII